MWIPPEESDPVVEHAPTRKNVSVLGAVCVNDGRLVTRQEKTFNAATFLVFLKTLVRHHRKGRKMIVVLDNARWHHAKLIQPWLNQKRHILRLEFLPPYSPDLNPVERVWKTTRRLCTHNRYFSTLEELEEVVFDQFHVWRKPNRELHTLCAII